MTRLKFLLIIFLLGVSACGGGGSTSVLYSGPVPFSPILSSGNLFPDAIEMQTVVDGQLRREEGTEEHY